MNASQKQSIFQITGKIFSEPYDWGGNTLIPQTLGFEPEPGKPYAEYWLGTHPKGPSQVELTDGSTESLETLIKSNPKELLGNTSDRFTTIPFLFKLLDARQMLSLQVHPNKKQAEEGYAKEENSGMSKDDPKRTYKDDNHKPEFGIVQGDFWLLHGFREKNSLIEILEQTTELQPLLEYFQNGDYKSLYKHVMLDLSDEEANAILSSLANRIVPAYKANSLTKSHPDYWAAKAIVDMNMSDGAYDRGLFAIYFLNLVSMKKGQALFQDAGLLHAYLEGTMIEVMANSDNVARGGITSKYVDVEELMKLVIFEGIRPNIVEGRQIESEVFYDAPIDEFAVSDIKLNGSSYKNTSSSPEVLLGMHGDAQITSGSTTLSVAKGKSVFVPANTDYEITSSSDAIISRTRVPSNNA